MTDVSTGESALSDAAGAAAARVDECRRRADALRDAGCPVTSVDVSRARLHLEEARHRALRAARRLEESQRVRREHEAFSRVGGAGLRARYPVLPPVVDKGAEDPAAAVYLAPLRSGTVDLEAVWLSYATTGGVCSLTELDAYVHGAYELDGQERAMLAHALWELEEFG